MPRLHFWEGDYCRALEVSAHAYTEVVSMIYSVRSEHCNARSASDGSPPTHFAEPLILATRSSPPESPDPELQSLILKRIETRLPGRIRNLDVSVASDRVILSGSCSTFYTKQLAQHAAMGVLDYEQLVNNIEVRSVK